MSLSGILLPELGVEVGTTRTVLERVPPESLAWKPHVPAIYGPSEDER